MSTHISVVSSLLAAGLWPLLILVLAVVGITAVALLRAEKQDIPAVFASFAQAFGFRRSSGGPVIHGGDDKATAPVEETDRPEEAL
ncbi:hypothetical protein ACQP0C_42070 (plasmid) [Nocardia sp. CA-129566]|uniref:hypothetical protein n=1 Tax=Nocardia sp. CA-129566 TaxID=3239976 RepID=UPI003D986E2C